MEVIKETIVRQVEETNTSYKAIDGTIFLNEKECREYEDTAAVVLVSKTETFSIIGNNVLSFILTNWFDGDEDNVYRVLVPSCEHDLDILNQLWFIFGGNKEPKFTKKDIGKLVLLGCRHTDTKLEWVWFYKLSDLIDEITEHTYAITPVKTKTKEK